MINQIFAKFSSLLYLYLYSNSLYNIDYTTKYLVSKHVKHNNIVFNE